MQQTKAVNPYAQIDTLHKNLKTFGLNPNNWKIFPQSKENTFLIVNRKNKEFKLIGISFWKHPQKPKWKDISVVSI